MPYYTVLATIWPFVALSFEFLDRLLIEWVLPVFRDRRGWLLCFLQDAFAVLASLGLELALFLDLKLDLALL